MNARPSPSRIGAALGTALIVLLGANGCSGGAAHQDAIALQLNWKPEPQFGGFYETRDLAAKQGLAVEVVPGGTGTPTVQMLAAGKVPFAVVSADEIVVARSHGADVVALFAVYQTNPQALMAHKGRGFHDLGELFREAGTVAMQKGLPYATFLEHKFGFQNVKIVPSPGGDLTMFRADPNYAMQAFVTSEPLAATKAGLDPQSFLIADAGYNPYTTVLATRGEYRAKNPEQVRAVVKLVGDGWRHYLDDPTSANATMRKLNPAMDEETFRTSAVAQKPLIETAETEAIGLGGMTIERWQALVGQLVSLRQVESAPNPRDCFVWEKPAAAKAAQ